MKLLIDTNIILDFLLSRTNKDYAKKIFELTLDNDTYEYLSSSTITDIFYILNKQIKDSYKTQSLIRKLLTFISIANVTDKEINMALDLSWKDFEDAVQYAVAKSNNVNVIITNNIKDFEKNDISIMTPKEFLDSIENYKKNI